MKKIISLILIFVLLFSLASCGEYVPPADDNGKGDGSDNSGGDGSDQGAQQVGEPFTIKVLYQGKAYTPPEVFDESLAVKVRWSDGKTIQTATLDEDGTAKCYGLDGEYAISLLNLPDGVTFDPNKYVASNENRDVVVELLTLTEATGDGRDPLKCIHLSRTGVYRAEVTRDGQEIFYEFEPTKAGIYTIESMMDISANAYDPKIDIYVGTFANKYREKRIDGGGPSGNYTTNFSYTVKVDEKFIGNVYTFAIILDGKDATYPVNVDFKITYGGEYHYDWIISNFVYPSFIPNNSTYDNWYSDYASYLASDREKYGDSEYVIASVDSVVGNKKNIFDDQYFRLNPDDGYYHVYHEERYAMYGGWGPILYANITIPTEFIDVPFNGIEYMGNRNLTLSKGTENYKLFVEGYNRLIQSDSSYFCVTNCPCIATNGGACTVEDNCSSCTDDCRHISAKYKNQRGYADIAIEGRCPVTEELKDFLQKYSVSQNLFSDGNGWAEENHVPRFDAYEDSQWLFACGFYTD